MRGLLDDSTVPAVVILPERLAAERERFAAAGATVLVRPYPPSELYAALPPAPTAVAEVADARPTAPATESGRSAADPGGGGG